MRCDDVRIMLEEVRSENAPDDVRTHLASCAECAEWWREWRLVSAGFKMLSREEVPEPSWGFPERVVRRLKDAAAAGRPAEFFERAGRRVVWATLVVTLTVVLSLVVPSSGPVRAASEPEYLSTQYQVSSTQNYPIIDPDYADTAASLPASPGH
jgi:hypothetical protein